MRVAVVWWGYLAGRMLFLKWLFLCTSCGLPAYLMLPEPEIDASSESVALQLIVPEPAIDALVCLAARCPALMLPEPVTFKTASPADPLMVMSPEPDMDALAVEAMALLQTMPPDPDTLQFSDLHCIARVVMPPEPVTVILMSCDAMSSFDFMRMLPEPVTE